MHSPLHLGVVALLLATQVLLGQDTVSPPPAGPEPHPAPESVNPAPPLGPGEKGWDFSLAITYLLSDSREIVLPTFTADRGWLHLETRYNYEAPDTASAW
ncbi:MAG: hypothetical protein ACKOET_12905, partial [Verrucomicrobiota bacterium]